MKSNLITCARAAALMALSMTLPAVAQTNMPTTTTQFIMAQPPGEWLARVFLGASVQNTTGERVGEIHDLVFDKSGRISTVVLGIGGFLGLGEKNVAVPFSALTYDVGKEGARVIVIALTKDALQQAPVFTATEKTTLDTMKEKASDIGQKTVDKAIELKDQAAKKIDDMNKPAPVKQ